MTKRKKHPLDDSTEFASPGLIDVPLGRMGEICREDFYGKRLDQESSGGFCLLADMAIHIIERGWADSANMSLLATYVSLIRTFASGYGMRALEWKKLGDCLNEAQGKFRARVEEMKAKKTRKRKKKSKVS